MRWLIIRLSILCIGCTTATSEPPKPEATCRVTRCWPDYRCDIPQGSVASCSAGDDVSWAQTGNVGSCSEGASCVPGALCLVRAGERGEAIGVCE